VPALYDSQKPAPLVLALHGGGGTGKRMHRLTGLNTLADRHGFIAVYPDAVDKHWNDGRNLPSYRSQRENIDDVGFISALVEALSDQYAVDRNRVYVTGASNGAMMSFRLACELTHKIAAIAPVIGSMGENISRTCAPSRPIPVLIVGGTGDPLVPWNGGHVHLFRRKLGRVLSFADTARFWVEHNGCSADPDIAWLPDADPEDGTRIRKKVYGQCDQDVKVILYEIQGGGHTWPGGPQYLPEWIIGINSRDMDAGEVIWDFFEGFSRPH
jgi:polyhydroxybutyrate depolymerase